MLIVDPASQNQPHQPAAELPAYVPPTVSTFTDALLLEMLGPAQAARGYGPPP